MSNKSFLGRTIKPATDALNTASKWTIKKTADMTGELIRNKIADRFTRTASQSAATKSIKPTKVDKTTIKLKKKM